MGWTWSAQGSNAHLLGRGYPGIVSPEAKDSRVNERGGEVVGAGLVAEVTEYLVGFDGSALDEVSIEGRGLTAAFW